MGADVDDGAAAVGDHAFTDQRREPERPLEVEVRHRVEQLLGDVGQLVVQRRHAGVVDQHVDAPELGIDGVDQAVQLVPPPHVHGVCERAPARRGGDLLGGRDAGVVLAAGDDDIGAAPRRGQRHLPSQPPAATGDQDHAVGQVEKLSGVGHPALHSRAEARTTRWTKSSLVTTGGGIVNGYSGFLPIAVLTLLKNSEIHDQSSSSRSTGTSS